MAGRGTLFRGAGGDRPEQGRDVLGTPGGLLRVRPSSLSPCASDRMAMPDRAKTICIACGLQLGESPQLNRLSNGQTCPACRERVLDSIPPALPRHDHIAERSERMSLFDGMTERGEGEWPPAERQN